MSDGAPRQYVAVPEVVVDTVGIVVAQLANNDVRSEDIPDMIRNVFNALFEANAAAEVPPASAESARPVSADDVSRAFDDLFGPSGASPSDVSVEEAVEPAELPQAPVRKTARLPADRQEPVPAVPIENSVTPDAIISLEDGRPYGDLTKHLFSRGMTPQDYRAKWGLPDEYPMIAPNLIRQRGDLNRRDPVTLRRM